MPETRTARDLITSSLKRLGVIAGIETPTADLAADALERLHDLLETWSTEGLTLWAWEVVTSATPLPIRSATTPFYTIGPGGDLDTPVRPAWLTRVALWMAGSANYEDALTPLSQDAFLAEPSKWTASALPTSYYYLPKWPLGYLHLWPLYNGGAAVLNLRVYVPLPGQLHHPFTLDTVLDFPAGYYRAFRDALAIELAPEVGRQVDGGLLYAAREAKAQLERTNFAPHVLGMPTQLPGHGGAYDWRTDEGG